MGNRKSTSCGIAGLNLRNGCASPWKEADTTERHGQKLLDVGLEVGS